MGSILLFGLLLGMRHAVEADHLAAVASMSAGTRDRLSTVLRGATWGLGHTISLLVVGGLTLGLGLALPDTPWFERAVGLMLIVLGANVFLRMRRARIHVHVHSHDDGLVHLHAHRHEAGTRHAHAHRHAHRRFDVKAVCVGMVHGLAGSAALLLLIASAMTSPWVGFAYIAVFGVGSIIGMAALSAVIAVPLTFSARRLARAHVAFEIAVAAGTIVLGATMLG